MLAHGVTTIRLMTGTPEQLVLRRKSANQEILAPAIYAASPQFTGRKSTNAHVVTTELEARDAVRKSKQDGYDFIKVTTFLKPEVYEAIVDEANKQNIRVVGHADSRSVGLMRALKARQQIEHLDSYLEALLPETAPVKGSVSDIYLYNPKNWESIDYLDESKIPELARLTVAANPYVTPTLHLFKFTFGKGRTEESFKAQPDLRFYPQKIVDLWMGVSKKYLATAAPIEKREKYIAIRNKIVKAIHEAGGRVMAGSDTPEWLLLYGHTLHLELVDLRDAGLSNYAALEAATRNPALFLGTANSTGTIEKGKRIGSAGDGQRDTPGFGYGGEKPVELAIGNRCGRLSSSHWPVQPRSAGGARSTSADTASGPAHRSSRRHRARRDRRATGRASEGYPAPWRSLDKSCARSGTRSRPRGICRARRGFRPANIARRQRARHQDAPIGMPGNPLPPGHSRRPG